MTEKTKVVLMQEASGNITRVRVGKAEFGVKHAGPTIIDGTMGVSLTIADVEVTVEQVKSGDQKASA